MRLAADYLLCCPGDSICPAVNEGFSTCKAYSLFINGKDLIENPVGLEDFINRGLELKMLLDDWLSRW